MSRRRKVVDLSHARKAKAQAALERRLDGLAGQGIRPIPGEQLEDLILPKRKAAKTAAQVVSFRMDSALLKRIDAVVSRLAEAEPWRTTGRTVVVRMLLIRGLEAEEAKEAKR